MSAFVRIRGLPYSARADDIIEFFKDVEIIGGKSGIHFPQGPNGRSNGEAFIELASSADQEKAAAHHKEHMGRRYIEDMQSSMGRNPRPQGQREYVVRLRGLPYDTEKKEIYAFFNDYRSAGGPGPMMGGRPRDGGYPDPRGAYGPPPRRNSPPPFGRHVGGGGPRPGPYSRPPSFDSRGPAAAGPNMNGPPPNPRPSLGPPEIDEPPSVTGHSVRMRGLPFSASREEIEQFLAPLQPANIRMRFNRNNPAPYGATDSRPPYRQPSPPPYSSARPPPPPPSYGGPPPPPESYNSYGGGAYAGDYGYYDNSGNDMYYGGGGPPTYNYGPGDNSAYNGAATSNGGAGFGMGNYNGVGGGAYGTTDPDFRQPFRRW